MVKRCNNPWVEAVLAAEAQALPAEIRQAIARGALRRRMDLWQTANGLPMLREQFHAVWEGTEER